MTSFHLSLVVLCVAVLAALLLSHLVPTLQRPSHSVSSSALFEAAYLGQLNEVRRLLALHSNQSQAQGASTVQRAAALPRDSRNNTALHWAVKEWRSDTLAVVDELVAAGASLAAVNAAGTTPLHWAVHSDSDDLLTGLVHRLCPAVADSAHSPPTPSSPSTAARLAECGALLARNGRNETALHWAVDWQRPVAVSTLLRLADGSRSEQTAGTTAARELVHAADENGDTPLHRLPPECPQSAACRLIAQQLIARGANVTAENAAGRTPLAHFPTPTEAEAEEGAADAMGGLDEQAEQFRRNVTQHFSTLR